MLENFPRIKDIKPCGEGYRFSKTNLENLVNHINLCEEAIEVLTEKFNQLEKRVKEKINYYENEANPALEETILWHQRVADALKDILEGS